MTEVINHSFSLSRIFVPKLEGRFLKTPDTVEYDQAFRVGVDIREDKKITVLFGVSLTSTAKLNGNPCITVLAEVAADIDLAQPLGEVGNLGDIPLSANMLALIFPFVREKIHYFMANNFVHMFLLPVNTNALTKDLKLGEGLDIIDHRVVVQTKSAQQ